MEGISRIDSYKACGWYVRIYYKDGIHSKFFSDSKYGGKEKTLQKAKQYRRAYIKKNPPPPKLPFKKEPIASNTTGVSGVSETFQRSKNGEKIPCFSVFWAPKPNMRRMKRFYHHYYGSREEAFQAAAEFRKEKEREILRLHKEGKRN